MEKERSMKTQIDKKRLAELLDYEKRMILLL